MSLHAETDTISDQIATIEDGANDLRNRAGSGRGRCPSDTREVHVEGGPAAQHTRNLDHATIVMDDLVGGEKTQPFRCARRFGGKEWLEDTRL